MEAHLGVPDHQTREEAGQSPEHSTNFPGVGPVQASGKDCTSRTHRVAHRQERVYHTTQSGFGKHLGTQDSLALLLEHILGTHLNQERAKTLQKQRRMLVVVDIKHAFDTLPHASVLDTMCRLIVRSLPVNFVKAFLKGRHYVLRLGKHGSNEERNDVGHAAGSGAGRRRSLPWPDPDPTFVA